MTTSRVARPLFGIIYTASHTVSRVGQNGRETPHTDATRGMIPNPTVRDENANVTMKMTNRIPRIVPTFSAGSVLLNSTAPN